MDEPLDADDAHAYGREQADFGGIYVDGTALVVMFTDNLDHHRSRLVPLLRRPDRLRVKLADRTYAAVEASNRRAQGLLMLESRPHPEVVGVGIGMADGQFVVDVKVENLTESLAAAIREAVAPDEIVIRKGSRAHRG